MFVYQYLVQNLLDLHFSLQMLPLQKSTDDSSKVKPLILIDDLVDKQSIRLEPLSNKGLEKGYHVQEVESGIKLNQYMAEVETANIADTLEEELDVLAGGLHIFRNRIEGISELI